MKFSHLVFSILRKVNETYKVDLKQIIMRHNLEAQFLILCHLIHVLSVESYMYLARASLCKVLGMLERLAAVATPCILVYIMTVFFCCMPCKQFIHLPLSTSTLSIKRLLHNFGKTIFQK